VTEQRIPPNGGDSIFNNNGAGLKIDSQIGYVNQAHFYTVGPSATPRDRFAKAKNLLNGNMPRKAGELISEAVADGYRSTEVAYYWALSVVSGRSFDNLRTEHFARLSDCLAMTDRQHPDEWAQALYVITRFIDCLVYQDRFGTLDDAQLDQVVSEYDRLKERRQEEIRRHLDLIMTGAVQYRLDASHAAQIEAQRKRGKRASRAWKFFEPDPCEPVLIHLSEPHFGGAARATAAAGAVLTATGLLTMVVLTVAARPLLALALVAGAGGGGYLAARFGRPGLVRRERIAADDARFGNPAVPTRYSLSARGLLSDPYQVGLPRDRSDQEDEDEDDAQERRGDQKRQLRIFRDLAGLWVDVRFADENPRGAKQAQRWQNDTARLRRALTNHIRRHYARPGRVLSELNWLITWHARRARESWEKGTMREQRDSLLAAGGSDLPLASLGVVVAAVGLLCGLVGTFEGNLKGGLAALLAVGLGGALLYASGADSYAVRHDLWQAETDLLHEEHELEMEAFRKWEKELEDRPTDADMARWLDYDKIYVKNLVMNERDLDNRDVVTHAVLTEQLFPCRRARVLFGPPRYSRYRMIVLLLTEGGVQEGVADLDFYSGLVSNLRYRAFNYGKIDWAEVREVGVRFDSGRRSVTILDDERGPAPSRDQQAASGWRGRNWSGSDVEAPPRVQRSGKGKDLKDVDSLIFAKAFRLAIDGRAHLDVIVENFDHGFLDRLRENDEALRELALDNSGVTSAVQVLTTVAREGREWLRLQRQRRTRRVTDFVKSLTAVGELAWTPDPDTLLPPGTRIARGEIIAPDLDPADSRDHGDEGLAT
jgi:hypothetical protein